MTARVHKKTNGQRPHAGRFSVRRRPQAQLIAMRLLRYGAVVLAVLLLVSSSISDNIQKLVDASLAAARTDALSQRQVQARASLLRLVSADADAVRGMDVDDLALLFGTPGLRREERTVYVLQYLSPICAMDVYFKQGRERPAYVEYRLRDAGAGHAACVQSLFLQARFEKTPVIPEPVAVVAPNGRV